jgi:simple sugar transport system ATP-binding protein
MEAICKTFGVVLANDHIDFSIRKGEIHALLGENGSGKSTLMNMLSGIYMPDSGSIVIDGRTRHFHSPKDAIDAGVGMVHQHFKLVDIFSAKENIVAGMPGSFFVGKEDQTKEINQVAERYGLKVQVNRKIYNMSVGEKQNVEILKVLYRGAQLLILDEPTAVLTPQETKVLFNILRNMSREGCAIIIITHKLNEVLEVSDRVTVLHKGKSVGTVNTAETTAKELTELMVGRPISLAIKRPEPQAPQGVPLLQVEAMTIENKEKIKVIDGISFQVQKGEILGVAGIAGSGQKELCEGLVGLQKLTGKIVFQGEDLAGCPPGEIIKKGISMSFIPEDRLGMGLVGGMDIVDNILLKSYHNNSGLFVDRKHGEVVASEIVKRFDISTPSIHHQVSKLSGGNIQKVLLGREVSLEPNFIITAYPTRGLDIGASYHIYDVLNEQKQAGVGILYIGEDLDVLLELCDRIMVLHQGKIMGIVNGKTATKEELGMLMLGHRGEEAAIV